jgi:hypothetical protein
MSQSVSVSDQVFNEFWSGILTLRSFRNDMPDGVWDEVKGTLPTNEEDKITRAASQALSPVELENLKAEIQSILEDWGLCKPWK